MRSLESSSSWFLWSMADNLCSVCRESQSLHRDGGSRAGLRWSCRAGSGGIQCIHLVSHPAGGGWAGTMAQVSGEGLAECRSSALTLPGSQHGSCCGAKLAELPLIQKGAWHHLIPARDNGSTR